MSVATTPLFQCSAVLNNMRNALLIDYISSAPRFSFLLAPGSISLQCAPLPSWIAPPPPPPLLSTLSDAWSKDSFAGSSSWS